MEDWRKEAYNEEGTLWDIWYKDAIVAFTGTEEEADQFLESKLNERVR